MLLVRDDDCVMEQKHVLLSALGVGVGVGLGLASGSTLGRWTGAAASAGVSAEGIQLELLRLVVDGKSCGVTFEEFPYYLRYIKRQGGSLLRIFISDI